MMRNLFSHVAVALLSATFCCLFFWSRMKDAGITASNPGNPNVHLASYSNEVGETFNISPQKLAAADELDFRQVSKLATSSVVNITTYGPTGYRISSGSGVIMSSDGFIITNNHVIEEGNSYEVTTADKRKLVARRIGYDPTTDLALIKVNAQGLRPMAFGNSDRLEVGEWVLAVGNPFNLSSTVTAGIVSAKARNIQILQDRYAIESFIQTDAVVNPGNSGGALINGRGELVGINTAIMSESGGYEGYSFAIPSNLVQKVIKDIKEFGFVQRAILGVGIEEVSDELADQLDLPTVAGVYVNNITPGSSAQTAGLRKGDVIISINGIPTASVPELQEQVALYRPGDRINLEFFREGKRMYREGIRLKSLEKAGTSQNND